MSTAASPDFLLDSRGVHRALDAFVVGAAFDPPGNTAAFALGDGTVRLVTLAAPQDWREVATHDGAILAFSRDAGGGFLTGGDDGRLRRLVPADDGWSVIDIAAYGSKWVEHVAAFPATRGTSALLACAVGRAVHVFDGDGKPLKSLAHPSTVTGLTFDTKGKRIAASHYNGASLWFAASKSDNPRKLEWKGSHTGIVMSPDGDVVVTTMQENSLHGWRLSDQQHMRMSGYPQKTQSLSFSKGGKWLASSGAEAVVLWPFTGGGPMGKAPTELAGGDGYACTAVACHPEFEAVAAGFSDGLVVLGDIPSARILPVAPPAMVRSPPSPGARAAAISPSARKPASQPSSTFHPKPEFAGHRRKAFFSEEKKQKTSDDAVAALCGNQDPRPGICCPTRWGIATPG